jgi:hypothetical protein
LSATADLLLALLIVAGLYMVSTSRLHACVRASALQGILLGLLPIALRWANGIVPLDPHVLTLAFGAIAIKAVAIPRLLLRSIREAGVRREVEPMVSLHASILGAAALVGLAFWLGERMVPPFPVGSKPPCRRDPNASGSHRGQRRRRSQSSGTWPRERRVAFGLACPRADPGSFRAADVLVGVFVMGIAIHHISRTLIISTRTRWRAPGMSPRILPIALLSAAAAAEASRSVRSSSACSWGRVDPHRRRGEPWVDRPPRAGRHRWVDALGLLVLTLVSALFLASSLYSIPYLTEGTHDEPAGPLRYAPILLLFLGAMSLVTVSRHLALLWAAVEATTLASAPLIYFYRRPGSLGGQITS